MSEVNRREFWIDSLPIFNGDDIVSWKRAYTNEQDGFEKHKGNELYHVIEFEAYQKAVEALKVAQKENEKLLKFKEEMWKLGQALPPNAISMMIQRELGKL